MKRTILNIAYPLTPVGPDAVGGSEQMLTLLDRKLTAAGHHSIVIAARGSQVEGTLIPSPPPPPSLNEESRRMGQEAHADLIREALSRYPVDLVHMHSLDFADYLPGDGVPTLATLHLPPDWYPNWIFNAARDNLYLNCVSQSQHRQCPPCKRLLTPISNGVDVERFTLRVAKQDFVLSLGRICPEKGFHDALEAARKARCEMILAGEVFPYESHLRYFQEEITPRLDARRKFVGPVGFERKRRLLAQARCLLAPSTVAETSSLVAMEAIAAGTPVIAYRSGALPEVVEDGVTGFIVDSVEEMADAIRRIPQISPEVCRQQARCRFSSQEMVKRYLEVYADLTPEPAYLAAPRLRPGISWLIA